MSGFAIVVFSDENTIDFVPIQWVGGDTCAWPTKSSKPLTAAQCKFKNDPNSKPGIEWSQLPISFSYFCKGSSLFEVRETLKEIEKHYDAQLANPFSNISETRKRKLNNDAANPVKTRILQKMYSRRLSSESHTLGIHPITGEPFVETRLNQTERYAKSTTRYRNPFKMKTNRYKYFTAREFREKCRIVQVPISATSLSKFKIIKESCTKLTVEKRRDTAIDTALLSAEVEIPKIVSSTPSSKIFDFSSDTENTNDEAIFPAKIEPRKKISWRPRKKMVHFLSEAENATGEAMFPAAFETQENVSSPPCKEILDFSWDAEASSIEALFSSEGETDENVSSAPCNRMLDFSWDTSSITQERNPANGNWINDEIQSNAENHSNIAFDSTTNNLPGVSNTSELISQKLDDLISDSSRTEQIILLKNGIEIKILQGPPVQQVSWTGQRETVESDVIYPDESDYTEIDDLLNDCSALNPDPALEVPTSSANMVQLRNDTKKIRNDTENMRGDAEKMRNDTGKMGSDTGKMRSDTGKRGRDRGKVRSDTSKMGRNRVKMRSDTEKTANDTGIIRSDTEEIGNDTGKMRSDTEEIGNGTGKMRRDTGKMRSNTDKMGNDTGKMGSDTENDVASLPICDSNEKWSEKRIDPADNGAAGIPVTTMFVQNDSINMDELIHNRTQTFVPEDKSGGSKVGKGARQVLDLPWAPNTTIQAPDVVTHQNAVVTHYIIPIANWEKIHADLEETKALNKKLLDEVLHLRNNFTEIRARDSAGESEFSTDSPAAVEAIKLYTTYLEHPVNRQGFSYYLGCIDGSTLVQNS